jgi:glycerol kinase
MKKYFLSIDQGTTSSRVVLYNTKFKIFDSIQKELKQYFPMNGWVEHDAEEIWQDVKFLINKILKKNKIDSSQIISIGIANQRETTIIWNRQNGKPINKAIVWQDRRTTNICKNLKNKKLEKKIQKITGLLIDPYFSATKIKWILDNNKRSKILIKEGNLLFGTVDTWILWNLTKKKSHLTDITNASRTMLFDVKKEKWSNELLKILNIPMSIMPKITPNTYNFGSTDLFGQPIKIGGMAGDQQAAAIGQACFKKGQAKSTYGTGCFLLMNIGNAFKLSKHKLLTTVAYKVGKEKMFCYEGSIFVAGSAIQWLRDKLHFFEFSKQTNQIYLQANKKENIIVIPALSGLGAPHWEPNVRGGIFGLTRDTSVADIVKATIDSIAYQTLDLVSAMQKDSKIVINKIKVDGAMINNNNLIQSIANILDIKILKPKNIETTSLGVAYLAGISSGYLKDLKSIEKIWEIEKTYISNINKKEVSKNIKNWRKAVKILISLYS